MTPEELNRTIEFLVQHQAQFSVQLERNQEMLTNGFAEMQKGMAELQKSMKVLAGVQSEMASNHRRIADLFEIQSRRIDRHDEAYLENTKWQRQIQEWQRQFQEDAQRRHEEALSRLDRILERLTKPPVN